MTVEKNPYLEWEKSKSFSDYRNTDTQITNFVRQQLSESEYLRSSNRVNPGPGRNARAKIADSTPQIPHVLGSEDLWGWQRWTQVSERTKETPLADNLPEGLNSSETPGADYSAYDEVGGASH